MGGGSWRAGDGRPAGGGVASPGTPPWAVGCVWGGGRAPLPPGQASGGPSAPGWRRGGVSCHLRARTAAQHLPGGGEEGRGGTPQFFAHCFGAQHLRGGREGPAFSSPPLWEWEGHGGPPHSSLSRHAELGPPTPVHACAQAERGGTRQTRAPAAHHRSRWGLVWPAYRPTALLPPPPAPPALTAETCPLLPQWAPTFTSTSIYAGVGG